MAATANGKVSILRLLLAKGASVEDSGPDDSSVLAHALFWRGQLFPFLQNEYHEIVSALCSSPIWFLELSNREQGQIEIQSVNLSDCILRSCVWLARGHETLQDTRIIPRNIEFGHLEGV